TWFVRFLMVAGLVFFSGAFAAPGQSSRLAQAMAASGDGSKPLGQRFSNSSSGVQLTAGSSLRKNPDIWVDPRLMRQLQAGGTRDFVIEFVERPDLSAAYNMDWSARGSYVYNRLKQTADASQADVSALLRKRGERFERYIAKNAILVRAGSQSTLQSLLTAPNIKRLIIPPKYGLIMPERFAAPDPKSHGGKKGETGRAKVLGSNIGWVEADRVWNELGFDGAGAVVGSIDSGVRYDHEALVNQYRGNQGGGNFDHNFNWFDPELGSVFPAPSSSAIADQHGTHTTG